jgi:hypothetical protein
MKRRLPLAAIPASKGRVIDRMVLPLTRFALCSALLTACAGAQTRPNPPSSAVASPSTGSIQSDPTQPGTIEPGTPVIEDDSADPSILADPASLLPELPALPQKSATLIGGTLERLDRVRDQITVQVFGGGRISALFDPRTRVYRGGKEVTIADLQQGQRVYLDTILNGSTVFARTIRLSSTPSAGEGQGIVLRYGNGELTFRDALNPSPVRVRLAPSTQYFADHRSVAASTLVTGSLVGITFDSQGNGHEVARAITILALPGTGYVFSGQVVHLDLRTGLLALISSVDHKTYEVYLDSTASPDDNLQPGVNVTVVANFEDSRYVARTITIDAQNQ